MVPVCLLINWIGWWVSSDLCWNPRRELSCQDDQASYTVCQRKLDYSWWGSAYCSTYYLAWVAGYYLWHKNQNKFLVQPSKDLLRLTYDANMMQRLYYDSVRIVCEFFIRHVCVLNRIQSDKVLPDSDTEFVLR